MVKHQVWKNPSPLRYCSCVNLFTVSMRPRAKRFPTVPLQQPAALFLQQQNKPPMGKKDLHRHEENRYLPPKMRWGFRELTCADFGEQQQSLSSKELQSQRERRLWMLQRKEQHRSEAEAAYWGRPAEEAVFSPHTGHQAGLQFSPVWHQFPVRSLFLLRRVRQKKKKPQHSFI